MSLNEFIENLGVSPEAINFSDTMAVIDAHYEFTPVFFSNGDIENAAGQNNGSCKIFFFARLHQLTEEQTLHCFGDFYRKDVLESPEGDGHQNIRNFIHHGWQGIRFDGEALVQRPS